MNIISSPAWQFVGVVIAVITFVFYMIHKQKKSLSYEYITNTRLLSVSESIKANIKILYDNKQVNDVYLLEINIFNSGNTSILEKEYNTGITFDFGSNSKVLTASVIFADPADVNPKINTKKSKVIVDPVLLNKGDSIILKVIATQVGKITVEGRIIGVKKIEPFNHKKGSLLYTLVSLLIMVFILVDSRTNYISSSWIKMVLMIFAMGLVMYADNLNKIRISNYKKRMKKYMESRNI